MVARPASEDLGRSAMTPDLFGAVARRSAGPPTSSFGRFRVSGARGRSDHAIRDVGRPVHRLGSAGDRVTLIRAIRPDPPARPAPAQDWRVLVVVFWVTSMVEGLGVSQIFALVPDLSPRDGRRPGRSAGVRRACSASLIFVVGMPLVPLWGVWADKYSRKAVIVRSALVEAVVFAGVALSREPWQLAV